MNEDLLNIKISEKEKVKMSVKFTVVHKSFAPFGDDFLSAFWNCVVLRLIEQWKRFMLTKKKKKRKKVGAIIMEQSEAFDCIPPDLLVVK